MREIKFRVWDKETKRLFVLGDGHDTFMFLPSGASYYNLQNGSGGDDYDLMQFTGLNDKTGKEIFEGDICTGMFYPGKSSSQLTYSVEFLDGGFQFINIHDSTDGHWFSEFLHDSIEVIGNIYETPELLTR